MRTHFHVVAVCRNSEQDGRRQTALVVDAGDGERHGDGAHHQEPEGPVKVDSLVPGCQPTAMRIVGLCEDGYVPSVYGVTVS